MRLKRIETFNGNLNLFKYTFFFLKLSGKGKCPPVHPWHPLAENPGYGPDLADKKILKNLMELIYKRISKLNINSKLFKTLK